MLFFKHATNIDECICFKRLFILKFLRRKKHFFRFTNLFAVKSNTLNRLFHPYGIIRFSSDDPVRVKQSVKGV